MRREVIILVIRTDNKKKKLISAFLCVSFYLCVKKNMSLSKAKQRVLLSLISQIALLALLALIPRAAFSLVRELDDKGSEYICAAQAFQPFIM